MVLYLLTILELPACRLTDSSVRGYYMYVPCSLWKNPLSCSMPPILLVLKTHDC